MNDRLLVQKYGLTLALVERLTAAAEREIEARQWAMFVAIVDDGGTPLQVTRVNDAQPGSYRISLDKARCAARFRRPTKIWAERVNAGAPNVLSLPGVVASEGGLPLYLRGSVVGAVGISGGTGEEDGLIAAAVAQAMAAAVDEA